MVMTTNPKPTIQSARCWTPNGQGELRTRRTVSLTMIGARKEKDMIKLV